MANEQQKPSEARPTITKMIPTDNGKTQAGRNDGQPPTTTSEIKTSPPPPKE